MLSKVDSGAGAATSSTTFVLELDIEVCKMVRPKIIALSNFSCAQGFVKVSIRRLGTERMKKNGSRLSQA